MSALHSVDLADAELAMLDGRCNAKAQAVVTAALARMAMAKRLAALTPEQAGFIADVVSDAIATGRVGYRRCYMRTCRVCGRNDGYATFARASRHHRKGGIDYDSPRYVDGWDLAERSVVMRGHPTLGCCDACFAALKPALLVELADVKAEVSKHLTGIPPRWLKRDRRKCDACGWEGNEGEMRLLPAVMSGNYPGGCPKCPANNMAFGRTIIQIAPGFDMVSQVRP